MKQSPLQPNFVSNFQQDEEWRRLRLLTRYEEEARLKGFKAIAGLDEAGRGPLAGPVVVAACMIPEGVYIPYVNDSKKLTAKMRQFILSHIQVDPRIVFSIGIVDSKEIDRINIYQATLRAMEIAVNCLVSPPDCLLVDGIHFPHPFLPSVKIIKGDTLSQSIAAASIIAKETRDDLMREYHQQWPEYGFDQHKGYGTPRHLQALEKHGPCDIHRRSFSPIQSLLERVVN
jgi:ribonuclease HII